MKILEPDASYTFSKFFDLNAEVDLDPLMQILVQALTA